MSRQERREARSHRRELKRNAQFDGLGVLVADGNVYRWVPGSWKDPELLGPVKGAHAEVLSQRR